MVRKRKPKTRIGAPIGSTKMIEKNYQRELNKLGRALAKSINEELLPFLKANQSEYVIDKIPGRNFLTVDAIGGQLGNIFLGINEKYTGVTIKSFSKAVASNVVGKTSQMNKKKFDKSVQRATGIDLGGIIATEGLEDFVTLSIAENVTLIQSLPTEYLKEVEVIVNNGVKNGTRYSEIAKRINAKVGSANSKLFGRIRTIAMNEIQTINSQLTLRRANSLGVTRGVYRTSEDEKVRKSHKELNGVEYDLAKGAWSKTAGKFIQPGITDINCRCSFSPVIEVE